MEILKVKMMNFELKNSLIERNSMTMVCASKRDFQIGVLCTISTLAVQVMPKLHPCARCSPIDKV